MAKVLLKNSFTAASVPAGLSAGEMAVNVADRKLFVGNAVGGVVTLVDPNALVTSVNGATGAVQGVSAAVAGTGISVSGATGSVTITYDLYAQTNKATPVAADLVQINNGSANNQPRNATIGAVLDIIAGDVAVSNTGASTYSNVLTSTKGGFGVSNSAGTNGQILVAKSTLDGDPVSPTQYVVTTLGTGTGISTTTGEGTLQINNTGVLSFNGLTGAVTGITAGGANTFTQLNTFSAGISASSGVTFASDISVNSLTVGAGGGGSISNVAVGYGALAANTDGTNNIAVGRNALIANTEGADNVAVGRNALNANTEGTNNIAVGTSALTANTNGGVNIAVGTSALAANSSGSNNVALGHGVLDANTTGGDNIGVGTSALGTNGTGSNNIAVGTNALLYTTGNNNIAVGTNALDANTTGTDNLGVGPNALGSNINGINNVGLACDALFTNTSGSGNIAVGCSALYGNSSGGSNVALATNALGVNSTGSSNIGLGENALGANTTGSTNVGIGRNAGRYRGTGTDANSTGQGGIYIGYQARGSTLAQTNEIVIGVDALGLGSNTAVIGATAQSAATIYGVLNLPSGVSAAGATFNGTVNIGTTALISAPSATALAIKSQIPAGTGVTPTVQIICPSAAFTLLNQTATQPVFSTPQDTITLQASTTYMFEGHYLLTTGTTSHTTSMSFVLTTATITNCTWTTATTMPSALNTTTSGNSTAIFNSVTGGVVNAGSTNPNTMITFKGIMRVNAGGTMVPNIAFSAQPGGTNNVLIGSYLKFYPIGSNTIDFVGTAIG